MAGKEVLSVEDIIDSGRTLAYLIEILKQRNPKSIRLCTLLDKPERRVKKQVKVDYTCFTIPDEFVVGYGLDYDQKYRNLPSVSYTHLDVYKRQPISWCARFFPWFYMTELSAELCLAS